jgi:hypothetical protein
VTGNQMAHRSALIIASLALGCVQEEPAPMPDDAGGELNDAAGSDTVANDGFSEVSTDVSEMDTYDGEPIYEQLPFDDPNLVCCMIRELTSQCGELYQGGRRRCDQPIRREAGGYPDARLDLGGWEDTVIDGCPVWVQTGSSFATCRGSLEGSGGAGW